MFEMLEFEWRPRGGRSMPRSRPAPRMKQVRRPRPGPRPRPAPAGGFWPYRVPVYQTLPLLEPEPLPLPALEPVPPGDNADNADNGGDNAGDDGGENGETPPTLGTALAYMQPGTLRPAYRFIGDLRQAPNHSRTKGPGLYYLEFTVNGRRRGYSGMSQNMSERLEKHRTCAGMMGIPPEQVATYVAPDLFDAADRRRREWTLHDVMLTRFPGVLTNQRRELEFELLGEEHENACRCGQCSRRPFSDEQETVLAMELLSVASEAELEQFLGKMFKGIWKGIKKIAKPLGGILKGIAKKALPFVGGALGSFIPIPGVGTALGSALGGALGKALEMEMNEMPGVDRELEMARRFVRIAGRAAQAAGDSDGSPQAVRKAVLDALRAHAPRFGQS